MDIALEPRLKVGIENKHVILKSFRILILSIIVYFGTAAGLHAQLSPNRQTESSPPTISLREAVLKTIQANPGVTIQQETVIQGE